ncbi:MAG: DUF6273 domain-containing protein [Treponema sp.]|nr:DUF6273 domain-containing protein [Treponema sp.]
MNLFTKKNSLIICLFVALLFLFSACEHANSIESGTGGTSDNPSQEKPIITEDPDSYGESSLPDLTESSPFAGQSYLRNDEGDAIFFNNDGTCIVKTNTGYSEWFNGNLSYSFRQIKKQSFGSYTYNSSTHNLQIAYKGLYAGDRLISNSDDYVDYTIKFLKQTLAIENYTTVSIPQEWIDAEKKKFSVLLKKNTVDYNCEIIDERLIFENLTEDDEEYVFNKGNVKIKLYLNDYSIVLENGNSKFNMPIIFSLEDGKFSGADYKWEKQGSAAILKKIGDFKGSYEIEYGSCYLTLTEVTGNIPYSIKNMVNIEYCLEPKKSEPTKREYNPIVKTINYTVIGSDNIVAIEKAQAYITDFSKTTWSENVFTPLTSNYITGIYTNQDCTRSVMEKEIIDGGHVYVKLKNSTAAKYNVSVDNITGEADDSVTMVIQKPCTVIFDANDGSGKTTKIEFTAGIPFSLYGIDFDIIGKDGYYFDGWSKEKNATEKGTEIHENYCTLSEDTTLYAVWKKIYTVTIKDPEGICEDEVRKNTDGEYPTESVYLSVRNFSKDGYAIVGFSKNKNTTEPEYELYDRLSLDEFGDSTELTLYVVWRKTYSITCICDGKIEKTITIPKDYSISFNDVYLYTPMGYKGLDGWYIDEDCTLKFDFSTAITEDKILYSKRIPNKYTIIFDANNGTGETVTQEFFYNEEKPLMSNTFTPSAGMKFYHWSTSTTDSYYYSKYSDGEIVKNLTTTDGEEIILYAIWNYNVTYTLHETITILPKGTTNGSQGRSATYVYFGDFPQKIQGKDIKSDYTQKLILGENEYFAGSDGNWYTSELDQALDDNSYYSDGTKIAKYPYSMKSHYFKLEPIKWVVLTNNYNDTGKALLLAEDILIANRNYYDNIKIDRFIDGKTVYVNNYKESRIRAYLNGISYITKGPNDAYEKENSQFIDKGFLQSAFTQDAQKLIETVWVDNSASDMDFKLTGTRKFECADTYDKVFLLNSEEITNIIYGFENADSYGTGNSRIRTPTDFAKANSASTNGCNYWLRSPNCNVLANGKVYGDDSSAINTVVFDMYGVVPAICVDLPE